MAIQDYSTTASSNTAVGGVSVAEGMSPGLVNDALRALMADIKAGVANQGSNIASASSIDLGAATGQYVKITGTTTITALGTAAAGTTRDVEFTGALILTYNATSLILPGAASITTAAGDTARFVSEGSGNWRCLVYQRTGGAVQSGQTNLISFDASSALLRLNNPTTAATYFQMDNSTVTMLLTAESNTAGIKTSTSDPLTIGTNNTTRFTFAADGGLFSASATGGSKSADSINVSSYYQDGVQFGPHTLGTAVTLTNQTSVDFTGIPAWARKITINFVGVSTNGTSNPLIQIGISSGVETTGYTASSTAMLGGGSTTGGTFTAGFGVQASSAGNLLHGSIVLTLENASANTWACMGVLAFSGQSATVTLAGTKSLAGALDRVRLTTVNGTDTYDAGAVNILYE